MKRIIFLISLLLITGCVIWGQGQITRPKKTEPGQKENSHQTPKPKQTQTNSTRTLPNSTETINGITVHWNNVTQVQKSVITDLLNNMVYVEGGSFMMGADDSDAFDDEKPVHKETVSSFRIDKYEVTQKLWQVIMENNQSQFKEENLPVEYVSWNDCQDFIKKLNRLTGLTFRLPTEVEWEYAAKGGLNSKNFKFSGSNDINDVAWYGNNSNKKAHPVGTKAPNELELYDLSGNVLEWTSSKYSNNYNSSRTSNQYVVRGGAYGSGSIKFLRSSWRHKYNPTEKGFGVGLRLVL